MSVNEEKQTETSNQIHPTFFNKQQKTKQTEEKQTNTKVTTTATITPSPLIRFETANNLLDLLAGLEIVASILKDEDLAIWRIYLFKDELYKTFLKVLEFYKQNENKVLAPEQVQSFRILYNFANSVLLVTTKKWDEVLKHLMQLDEFVTKNDLLILLKKNNNDLFSLFKDLIAEVKQNCLITIKGLDNTISEKEKKQVLEKTASNKKQLLDSIEKYSNDELKPVLSKLKK